MTAVRFGDGICYLCFLHYNFTTQQCPSVLNVCLKGKATYKRCEISLTYYCELHFFYVKRDNAVSTAAPYWHCLHSMRSRVYETVRWPSDCPSTAANPLLQVCCCCGPGGQEMSIDLLLQLHANAGSATLSAYVCS